MEGPQSRPFVPVQRIFAQTRLSDDLLAQAYEHVLRCLQQQPTRESPATPPARHRKRVPRVATTGGRTS